mmetsp:Transcript_64791/g.156284  ORF Transcript_64791/g.156284 Transcript_64791/m.156284 type:complete len:343 (+) Transcript_64791:686-1714(+)
MVVGGPSEQLAHRIERGLEGQVARARDEAREVGGGGDARLRVQLLAAQLREQHLHEDARERRLERAAIEKQELRALALVRVQQRVLEGGEQRVEELLRALGAAAVGAARALDEVEHEHEHRVELVGVLAHSLRLHRVDHNRVDLEDLVVASVALLELALLQRQLDVELAQPLDQHRHESRQHLLGVGGRLENLRQVLAVALEIAPSVRKVLLDALEELTGSQGASAEDAPQRHVQARREPKRWRGGRRRRGRRRRGGAPARLALPRLVWKEGAHQCIQAGTQEAWRSAHNLLDKGQGGISEHLILTPALTQRNLDQVGVRLQLHAGSDLRECLQGLRSSGGL